MLLRRILALIWLLLFCYAFFFGNRPAFAQDAATGAIRGVVQDSSGARIRSATVVVVNAATGWRRGLLSDDEGLFVAQLLPPGAYRLNVQAPGMKTIETNAVTVELGSEVELRFTMRVAGAPETVTVRESQVEVEVVGSEHGAVIEEKSISDLPLNGRRFSDLALLAPGMVTDSRGMTSSSNGDLSSGGIRGFEASYLVDGADNNNGFFAQARGRYRAPYQFSDEVVQEFRVNTNNYGVELGRAGASVINVVTKSGSNEIHGKAFYYLRDSTFNATEGGLNFKPEDRQQQFGVSVGGPIKKNCIFYFGGFDQHIFRVPSVVQFNDGSTVLMPQPQDYEASDEDLVYLAAGALTKMAGAFPAEMIGNAGFSKIDWVVSPRNLLTMRVNTSSYSGSNNVYLDPASPATHYTTSENGEERVSTVTGIVSLTSGWSRRVTSHLRAQFSRDLQDSTANSSYARTQITDVIEAFGRSLILPRQTNESKLHVAETISIDGRRHNWKIGGDVMASYIYNFYPLQFGGSYTFRNIKVDPFTFEPWVYGMALTPLRAYAHVVPRYYSQNFGSAETRPDTTEYAGFVQDSIRLTGAFGISLGVRYDLQHFRTDRLKSNPLWPDSGHVPDDTDNFAPRVGFAYALGDDKPTMIRGGWGLFYTRIPSIYTSEIETEDGYNRSELFLDNQDSYDHQIFPTYPNAVADCAPAAKSCVAPASVAGSLVTQISAFPHNFQTPFVQEGSFSLERETWARTFLKISYTYTHGEHLIRARDVNLPKPTRVSYPVYDQSGTTFLGFFSEDSFTTWDLTKTANCDYPPCVGTLDRPIPQLGEINVFESAATSIYNGATVSLHRKAKEGLFFRLAYTWGRAVDDAQDALVAGRPATVQNSYDLTAEKARSSVDQRNRVVGSVIYQLHPFNHNTPALRTMFNDWKLAALTTYGSGRPVSAFISGDANADGNDTNDRLPGYSRNAFTGPNYSTTDLRLSRAFELSDRTKLELLVESFNLFNRDNKQLDMSDDGFGTTAATFVQTDTVVNSSHYPAQYRLTNGFMTPKSAYAPRQVQLAIRLTY